MGRPFLTQKQRLEVAKAGASVAEPEPEPPVEEWSNPAATQIITEPNSFRVFRKYSGSSASHNPEDDDPVSDIPSAQPISRSAAADSIGSDLADSSTRNEPDPLSTSTNPSSDLLIGWWATKGSNNGVASLISLFNAVTHPRFNSSELRGFNPVSALRRFEQLSLSSTPRTTLTPGDSWKAGTIKIKVRSSVLRAGKGLSPSMTQPRSTSSSTLSTRG